ncbi:hypothetical protein CGCSCA1_v002894 [Colletotrichum siamense]|nr:hypothetical protein CGCSCA1_v002894 [Colletotrichum siamense]
MMGDSVSFKGSKHAATLGPMLEFSGQLYWLVTATTFKGAFSGNKIPYGVKLVHPAEIDCGPDIFSVCLQPGGIGGELMATELRRALRFMGAALSLESKSREEKACSRRIRRDARFIADSVRRTCDPEFAGRRLNIDRAPLSLEDRRQKITNMLQPGQGPKETSQLFHTAEADDSDPEDDDQVDIDGAEQERLDREVLQRIRELENFILGSEHMQALKSNLRTIQHRGSKKEESHQHLEDISRDHAGECEGEVPRNDEAGLLLEVQQVTEIDRTLPEMVESWLPQWFDFLWMPRVPVGAERIRWKCTCGKDLYDDYYGLEEGQLQRLRALLNKPKSQDEEQQPGHHAPTTSWTLRAKDWTMAIISSAANAFKSNRGADTGIPLHNPTTIQPPTYTPVIPNTRGNQLFLLFSLESGGEGYAKVLRHAGVEPSKLENDNDLFKFLRQRFYAERKLASRLSLRTVSGIGNCMLRVDFSNFIQNLKRHSNACSSDSVFSCGCWPNPSAVSDYRYIPQTPTEPFLMEKNYLLHHFRNPGCLDPSQTSVICYIPMKKDSQLVGEASKPVTGWGIYFEEDWHWKTISVVITVFMIIVSTALGFTWWFVKSDFSGGWGVASFCVTSATLVVTVLGFMAHKSY